LKLHNIGIKSDELTKLENICSEAENQMALGDFESAVRVLNQTSGEPKRIFKQWLDEARLWLEVKQGTFLILFKVYILYKW